MATMNGRSKLYANNNSNDERSCTFNSKIRNQMYFLVVLPVVVIYILVSTDLLNTAIVADVGTPSSSSSSSSSLDVTQQQQQKDGVDSNKPQPPLKVVQREEEYFPKEKAQMSWEQVQRILQTIPIDGGNVLIWGLGYDSLFWHTVTTGAVLFLEDGDMTTNLVPNPDPNTNQNNKMVRWYDAMTYQYPQLLAYTVNYTTTNNMQQLQYYKQQVTESSIAAEANDPTKNELFLPQLPSMVYTTIWDAIIIDAPLGYPNTGPGRFQSIYMTQTIVNHTFALHQQQHQKQQQQNDGNALKEHVVHVFVDDYERQVEREFAQVVFNHNEQHPPLEIIQRPAYKQHVTPNEQAHYVFTTSTNAKQ